MLLVPSARGDLSWGYITSVDLLRPQLYNSLLDTHYPFSSAHYLHLVNMVLQWEADTQYNLGDVVVFEGLPSRHSVSLAIP